MVIDEESYSRCLLPIRVIYLQVHKERHARGGAAPEFSAYSLRHNYATSLYRQGASPVEIQLQMCHSSFKSTQKYIHSDYEHQKKVANKLRFTNRDRDEEKTA